MRVALSLAVLFATGTSAVAQNDRSPSQVTPEQREAVSDKRAAEVRADSARAKRHQARRDRQNTDLWARWTYAVCIGCTAPPKGLRVVHTYPHRVLIGIPAAMDDQRERRGLHI